MGDPFAWPTRTFEIRVTESDTVLYSTCLPRSFVDALERAYVLGRYHGHPKVTLYWGDDRTDLDVVLPKGSHESHSQ